jgi:outer membrane immunogenic protein
MRQTALFASLTTAWALAGHAIAADLPRGAAPAQGYYDAPAPVQNWQGFYLGVNAGYSFGAFQDGGRDLLGSPNGGLIGITAGYNFVLASNFLVGLEGDFAFAGLKASRSPWPGVGSRSQVDDLFTLRGRAGVTLDRALLFLTGGFAASNNRVAIANAFANFYGEQSKFQPGWALGGGLEYAITNNISAKAEYVFTSVGGEHYFDFSPNVLQSSYNASTVKGGVNYHF